MDVLKNLLRSVDRMLVVGWRGVDDHFVHILREHLPNQAAAPLTTLFVCGNKMAGMDVHHRLVNAGLHLDSLAVDTGFSGFITQRLGKPFLRDPKNS